MPLIQVWECPKTKKLFKTKSVYVRHLKSIAANNFHENSRQREISKLETFLESSRNKVKTIDELKQYFIDNYGVMSRLLDLKMGASKYRPLPKDEQSEGSFLTSFDFSLFQRKMVVSNTHHAPIKDGIINWSRSDPSLPIGYPGYTGEVTYSILGQEGSNAWNEVFRGVGLNNGTGGLRSPVGKPGTTYGFDFHIYLADFPGLVNEFVEFGYPNLGLSDYAELHKISDTSRWASKCTWTAADVVNFEHLWPTIAEKKSKEINWEILSGKYK